MLVKDLLEHMGALEFWQWVLGIIGLIFIVDTAIATTVLTHYWRTEIKPHRNQPTTTPKE